MDLLHLPSSAAGTGAVGIFHETHAVSPGTYENIYVDMPSFGLGQAGSLEPVTRHTQTAAQRMRRDEDSGPEEGR